MYFPEEVLASVPSSMPHLALDRGPIACTRFRSRDSRLIREKCDMADFAPVGACHERVEAART